MTEARVFDACSILLLIRRRAGGVRNILAGGYTTSLAPYELGNAIWRETFLLNSLTWESSARLMRAVYAALGIMEVMNLGDVDLGLSVLAASGKHRLSYYDSSYLVLAKGLGAVLVTDDNQLAKAALEEGLETQSSSDIV